MEKIGTFPTFSIFHALGSILTTGGVLGSWTSVKLLSSPFGGRENERVWAPNQYTRSDDRGRSILSCLVTG